MVYLKPKQQTIKSLNSVIQHAAKQREFWELSTVVLVFRHPDIMLAYVSIKVYKSCTGQTPSWILYNSVVPTLLQRQRTDWKCSKKIHSHDSRPQGSPIRAETCSLAKTKLWSLEDRRTRADLIEIYKIIHELSTVRFHTFFEFSHNERTKGHSLKLHKKRVMTDLRQHFFSDTLSEDIVSASSLNNFKGKLQRLHNDGSSTGFYKSAWPSGSSQLPGEAHPVSYDWLPCTQPGKLRTRRPCP